MHCVDLGESFPTSIDLQKLGFDTAENEPCKVCPLSAYRSPRFLALSPPLSGRVVATALQKRAEAWAEERCVKFTVSAGGKKVIELKLPGKRQVEWAWSLEAFTVSHTGEFLPGKSTDPVELCAVEQHDAATHN